MAVIHGVIIPGRIHTIAILIRVHIIILISIIPVITTRLTITIHRIITRVTTPGKNTLMPAEISKKETRT